MAKYTPRTTAPSTNNKNYMHTSAGGYNPCILIGKGSVLPNCVGYAWGRWRELLGKSPKLSRSNAENWWGNTADGYKRGQTPKLGAVMCWRKGKAGVGSDGAGHVAIVEKIDADGTVTCSNSGYGGPRFYNKTMKPPYSLGSAYTFQGFIYLPIDFDEDEKKEETKKPTSSSKYKTGDYRVTASLLNVRSGPGMNYAKKTFKQLTENAQKQVRALAGYKANGYPKGVEFTALEVKGDWGRTPSGWVNLDYCKKI